GLFGSRTQAAVLSLQKDLTAAGLYSGPANGSFDGATAKALARLHTLPRLPASIDPSVARRLLRLNSPPLRPVARNDTFDSAQTPGAAPQLATGAAPQTQGAAPQTTSDQRGMMALLDALARQQGLLGRGPAAHTDPGSYQRALALAAAHLQEQPNTRAELR